MLGTGQQHWPTVHVADLAGVFRRVLENDSAHENPDRQRADACSLDLSRHPQHLPVLSHCSAGRAVDG